MIVNDGSNSFLMGISLAEISFILFFLLLLISASALQKKDDELTSNQESIQSLKQEIIDKKHELDEAFKKLILMEDKLKLISELGVNPTATADDIQEAFKKLTHQISNLKKELLEKQFKLLEESELVLALAEENNKLKDKFNKISAIEDKLNKMADIEEKLKGLGIGDNYEDLIKIIESINKDKESLAGQRVRINKLIKSNGLDNPPCWVDKSGRIEYLYQITIYENNLEISPAWPAHREPELNDIPNSKKASSKTYDIKEFSLNMNPIYQWSKKQNPECRHFVRVIDTINTTKEAYKNNLSTIENYFYKSIRK